MSPRPGAATQNARASTIGIIPIAARSLTRGLLVAPDRAKAPSPDTANLFLCRSRIASSRRLRLRLCARRAWYLPAALGLAAGGSCRSGPRRSCRDPAGVCRAWHCLPGLLVALERQLAAHHPYPRLGLANRITLVRAAVACVIAAGRSIPPRSEKQNGGCSPPSPGRLCCSTAADGWAARRQGLASAFGARFDMEVDAFAIAVLAIIVVRAACCPVLGAGHRRDALPLSRSGAGLCRRCAVRCRHCAVADRRRKTIAVVQSCHVALSLLVPATSVELGCGRLRRGARAPHLFFRRRYRHAAVELAASGELRISCWHNLRRALYVLGGKEKKSASSPGTQCLRDARLNRV